MWGKGANAGFVHGFRKGIECLQEPWEAFLKFRPFVREAEDIVTVLQLHSTYFHKPQLLQASKQAGLFVFGFAFGLLERRNLCPLWEADMLPVQQFGHGEQLQAWILPRKVFGLVEAR